MNKTYYAVEIIDNENIIPFDLFLGVFKNREKSILAAEEEFSKLNTKQKDKCGIFVFEFESEEVEDLADIFREKYNNLETFDIALVVDSGTYIFN